MRHFSFVREQRKKIRKSETPTNAWNEGAKNDFGYRLKCDFPEAVKDIHISNHSNLKFK